MAGTAQHECPDPSGLTEPVSTDRHWNIGQKTNYNYCKFFLVLKSRMISLSDHCSLMNSKS